MCRTIFIVKKMIDIQIHREDIPIIHREDFPELGDFEYDLASRLAEISLYMINSSIV